ncbi:MAG: cyclic nucleotide-binding domain-containing protein [Chloroflexota bacterium]|nr:cyclic nucleotide-binding domain-containing protein [Chloroflexota bacterium]
MVEKSEYAAGLKACELFAVLSDGELDDLLTTMGTCCRMEEYEAGDTVFNQGELATRAYVVVDGQILISRSFSLGDRMATKTIALLGKGRAMGWSALVYEDHYASASALCQKPTRLVALEGHALRQALEQDHSVGFRVMRRLATMLGDRLQSAYSAIETHL